MLKYGCEEVFMEKDLLNDTPRDIPGLDKVCWIGRDYLELGRAQHLKNGSWRLFDTSGNAIGDFEDFDTPNLFRRGGMYYKKVPHGWVNCPEAEAKKIYMNSEMGYIPEEWRAAHPSPSDEERRKNGLLHCSKPDKPTQMGE